MAGKQADHTELTLAEAAEAAGVSKQTAHAAEVRAMRKLRQGILQDSELLQIVIDLFGCVPEERQ